MHVLDDDRFGVGFEFEFVVADSDLLIRDSEYVQICDINWDQFKHAFELFGTNKRQGWLEAILLFQEYRNPKVRWEGDFEEYGDKFGWAWLIAILGLRPRHGWWFYKNRYGDFLDRTPVIEDAMKAVNPGNEEEVKRFARRLNRYYVQVLKVEAYGCMRNEDNDAIFKRIGDTISWRTGHNFRHLNHTSDDDPKKRPDWYITDEHVEDMRDYAIDSGIELTTPVMTPRVALKECENIMNAVLDSPYRVYTGPDCGLHINISHTDIGVNDVSILEFALVYDEVRMAKPFGRSRNMNCEIYRKAVRKTIRELIQKRVISLNVFDENPDLVMRVIESSINMQKMSSMHLGSLHEFGYVEYRLPGGTGYLRKFSEVKKHLVELLKIHRGFGTNTNKLQKKVRQLLIRFGAGKNDGISLIQTVPRSVFKL